MDSVGLEDHQRKSKSSKKVLPTILGGKRKEDHSEGHTSGSKRLIVTENRPLSRDHLQKHSGSPVHPSLPCRIPLASISYNSLPRRWSRKKNDNKVIAKARPVTPETLRVNPSWWQFRNCVQVTEHREVLLPKIRWADSQEIWKLVCSKEHGVYSRGNPDDMLARHPGFQPRTRAILLDWFVEVCEAYKLHRETFYLAVDYTDRFLGSTSNVPRSRLQLTGVTCLFIAAKMEEIYPPKVENFAYVTDGACNKEEILSTEITILKALCWAISPMTLNSWVKLYMQIKQSTSDFEVIQQSSSLDEDLILPRYSGKRFTKVMQLLDLCILDIGSLAFKYSILAASAIYHCEDETTALQASGYKWDEISQCVTWMAPFVFALRESQASSSCMEPTKPETCDIQVHAVELSVLNRAWERQKIIK